MEKTIKNCGIALAMSFLSSAVAVAQLPYNPDANSDGLIGAYDLTSLLSLYSNSFSNGLLETGTQMATLANTPFQEEMFYVDNSANSWVVDLTGSDGQEDFYLFSLHQEGNQLDELFNGLTVTFIHSEPAYRVFIIKYTVNYNATIDQDWSTIPLGPDAAGNDSFATPNHFTKVVFWNGLWHSER